MWVAKTRSGIEMILNEHSQPHHSTAYVALSSAFSPLKETAAFFNIEQFERFAQLISLIQSG
jgi:hypothetical protein